MERNSTLPVMNRTFAHAILAAFSARPAAALMDAPKIVLLKVMPDMTPDVLYAAFTEADFTGYAAVAAGTLAGPVLDSGDCASMLCSSNFVAGSPLVTPNDVVGYVVANTGKTDWYYGEKFVEPCGIAEAFAYIDQNTHLPIHLRPQL